MGLIKSAFELAMEKSEGLTVDKEALKQENSFKKGRTIGLKSLSEGVDFFKKEWKLLETDKEFSLKDGKLGVMEAWLSTFTLKIIPEGDKTILPLDSLMDILTGKSSSEILSQIKELLDQFQQDAIQLKTAIIQQLGPRLKQRAEQMAAQSGTAMRYVMERDPEFVKVMNQNLEKLREQYLPHLEMFKKNLTDLL
ncbi:MAG: hypothetical protein A2Z96_02045 [Spirochaetes bacterium GWB1_48_6]|nr:MAG: hypothetical protein A2Z96_02045 [Spirochaetes bacterium GWB1_48_6]